MTSRVVLHLRGEKEFPVPPLALPPTTDPGQSRDEGDRRPLADDAHEPVVDGRWLVVIQYAAVQLFIARALDAQPNFAVTNENAPAVAEICCRLDGLPLAIELAAARIKLFAPQALLSRLSNRLALLTGGPRDLPARQRTLRNTIDWSYELLSADEQRLFRRLGVFVGGCAIEAAEAVCGDWGLGTGDWETAQSPIANRQSPILDGLAALVDQSLLRQDEGPDGEPRFTLLETIREYALERLEMSGEAEAIHYQFATYYLALAETAAPELRGARQLAWLERLEAEHGNLRAALGYCLEARDARPGMSDQHDDDPSRKPRAASVSEIGLRLAAALWWFWLFRAYFSEGRSWLKAALERSEAGALAGAHMPARAKALAGARILAGFLGDTDAIPTLDEESPADARGGESAGDRALALLGLAMAAQAQADYTTARTFGAESVALFRAEGDTWGQAFALYCLASWAWWEGDGAAARPLGEESLALFRTLGNTWGEALALFVLGLTAHRLGDYERAMTYSVESLALSRLLEDRNGQAAALSELGKLARLQGDYTHAETYLTEAVALAQEVGDNGGVAWWLYCLAIVAQRQGDNQRARRLLAKSLGLFQQLQAPLGGIACFLEGMAEVAGSEGQPAQVVRWFGAAGSAACRSAACC